MKKIFLRLICAGLLLTGLTSCILVPAIDSLKKVGLTEGDRKQLLAESLKKFHDSVYWGSPTEAVPYIDSASLPAISAYLQETTENERIVESKVKNVTFEENAYIAVVDVSTRSFKTPVYIVNTRTDRERWRFSLSDGWKLVEIKELQKK